MNKVSALLLILLSRTLFSQTPDTLKQNKPAKLSFFKSLTDTTKRGSHFELSFGQNLLFISNSQQNSLLAEEALVLPTSSVLFFAEFRPQRVLRIPVFFNLATESKQYIVAGEIVNQKANPTFGTGLVFKVMQYNFDPKSKIEIEMGPLASVIFDNKSRVRLAPIFAMRVKICRGENFVMYLGGNYSLGVKAFGLMYGTGTVF